MHTSPTAGADSMDNPNENPNENPIAALKAQRELADQREAALLQRVETLVDDLTAAVGKQPVRAFSAIVTLDGGMMGSIYGKLCFADGSLTVMSRYSGDDDADAHYGVAPQDRWWSNVDLTKCKPLWREKLMDDAVLASLFKAIGEQLRARVARIDASLAAVKKVVEAESAALDAEMSAALAAAGDENLARLWQEAVAATHIDTADALTRCSRFLEAVCAKILRERGLALPKDKSMQPLVKACLDTLTWPDAKEAEGDVRQLLGGIQSICNGIGALRTHFGTAHGASSHLPPLDRGYAVFVKQATVAAATFLLDRHQASPPIAGAPPEPS